MAIDSVDRRTRQASRRTAGDRATDAAFAKTMRLVRRAWAHGIDPNRFTAERGERSLRWAVARATVAQRCAPACDWGGRGDWGFGWDNLETAGKALSNFSAGFVDGASGFVTLGHYSTGIGPIYDDPILSHAYRIGKGTATAVGTVALGGGSAALARRATGALSKRAPVARLSSTSRSGRVLLNGAAGATTNGAEAALSKGATWESVLASTVLGGISPRSIDDLSAAAGASRKGDLSAAGHALTKHAAGQRAGSRGAFPALRGGPASINEMAQFQVDDILTSPGTQFVTRSHPEFKEVLDVIAPDGRGVRFGLDGRLIGFLEPPR